MLVRPLVRVRSKRLSQNTPHYKFCADQAHEISCLPPRPTRERLANCSSEASCGWLARYHHSKRVSSDLSHRRIVRILVRRELECTNAAGMRGVQRVRELVG